MNSFASPSYDTTCSSAMANLHEAERLMNLSISKFQMACQHDLPLRRSLLIASVLNRAQRAAADAIASLDKPAPPPECALFRTDEQLNEDIEMHILGNDLLSEILCTDDKPDLDPLDCADNMRKRPRDSVLSENSFKPPVSALPSPNTAATATSVVSELHDSKRLKEDGDWGVPAPSPDMWILPPGSIWTTPVVC